MRDYEIGMNCKTLLVVEDDDDIRDSLVLALEAEGYTGVVGASNGKEALELLGTVPRPCLVLLDLMMPVMNGWEFLHSMRNNDILAVIPVVIVSAFSEQIKNENVQGVVKKPFELEALLRIVRSFCGGSDSSIS
jgi:CheY-like chemotaxis protein